MKKVAEYIAIPICVLSHFIVIWRILILYQVLPRPDIYTSNIDCIILTTSYLEVFSSIIQLVLFRKYKHLFESFVLRSILQLIVVLWFIFSMVYWLLCLVVSGMVLSF